MMSSVFNVVLSRSEVSRSSLSLPSDFSIGVFVNSETTSWEFNISPSSIIMDVSSSARDFELTTWCFVVPTKGDKGDQKITFV